MVKNSKNISFSYLHILLLRVAVETDSASLDPIPGTDIASVLILYDDSGWTPSAAFPCTMANIAAPARGGINSIKMIGC